MPISIPLGPIIRISGADGNQYQYHISIPLGPIIRLPKV